MLDNMLDLLGEPQGTKKRPKEKEMHHHLSQRSQKLSTKTLLNTSAHVDTILFPTSKAVQETDGWFVYQQYGKAHKMYDKCFLVDDGYRDRLFTYLNMTNGAITLEAKQAFERRNDPAIKILLKRAKDEQKTKKSTDGVRGGVRRAVGRFI